MLVQAGRKAGASERGSVPLAMLAVIIVAGVVTALLSSTITGQKAARYDRSYTTVIQAADAGIQEASQQIIRNTPDLPDGAAQPAVTGSLGDANYSWTMTKIDDMKWEVVSTGTLNGVERTVHAIIEDIPRFFFAAYADVSIRMAGGNSADSYDADDQTWFSGNGVVGTNGSIRLNGSSTGVDAVHLFNWDNYPDVNRCIHTGGNDCDDVRAMPDAIAPSLRIGPRMTTGVDLDMTFIDDMVAACENTAGTAGLDSFTSSQDGSSLPLPAWDALGDTTIHETWDGKEAVCFSDVTFDTDITITRPLQIYFTGSFAVGNHRSINMNCGGLGCPTTADGPMPNAADLQIYGQSGPVLIGNHTSIAAAIYAPRSTCGGNPSNAQGAIYGSMICGNITNVGGWSFHYDDRLREIGINGLHVESWRED